MPSIKGTHWSFTLNFTPPVPTLSFPPSVQYATWQHECVEHDHLQGYVQMKSCDSTFSQVLSLFAPLKPHLVRVTVNKTGRKPWEYASKDDTRVAGPWTFGIRIDRGSNKGKKIQACLDSPTRMQIEDPDLYRTVFAMELTAKFMEEFKPPVWDRIWQNQVNDLLVQSPDDRSILWCYGSVGGEGKSTFAKGLILRGFAYVDANKYADMFEMYHQQGCDKNIVVDFHRSCDVNAFYGFLEKVKNRVIPKMKYRSLIAFDANNVHVVVMANVMPDYDKISKDRIVLIECGFATSSKFKVKPPKRLKITPPTNTSLGINTIDIHDLDQHSNEDVES